MRQFSCPTVVPSQHPIASNWLCRWGPVGQGRLLCDLHAALVRVLEGLDEDLMEAPTMAGYGSATDLAPVDSYKPLLGAAWPELARRYLQEHGALNIGEDAVEAVLRLKVMCSLGCAVLDADWSMETACMQKRGALNIVEDAVEAVLRLKVT